MYILINISVAAICLLFGYLVGSFPTGVVIGKVFFKKDPRDYYSKNSGGTNCGRVFGHGVGAIVIIIDLLKTIVPVFSCWAILTFSSLNKAIFDSFGYGLWDIPLYYYLASFGTACGHCYPIWIGFKGGKAAANFMSFVLTLNWMIFLCSVVYLIVLKVKKYVSLSVVTQVLVDIVVSWTLCIIGIFIKDINWFSFWGWNQQFGLSLGAQGGWEYPLILTLIGTLCIYRHKENIIRIFKHEERKVTWIK